MLKKLWIRFFLIFPIIFCANGTFNLWLSHQEVKRTLGLSSDLYYVREGVVNEYALGFNVPVPETANALLFSWQALGQNPLPFTSSIEITDSLAMEKPQLNISSTKGFIPTSPQIFEMSLPCTGLRSAEVNIELVLNVTAFPKFRPKDITTITLKRKKICLADVNAISKRKSLNRGMNPSSISSTNGNSNEVKSPGQSSISDNKSEVLMVSTAEDVDRSSIIFIIVGCVLGLVFILLLMALMAVLRNRKGSSRRAVIPGCPESSGFLHVDTSASGGSGNGSSGSGHSGSHSGTVSGSLLIRSESPHHYSSVSPCPGENNYYAYSTFQPNLYSHYAEICSTNKNPYYQYQQQQQQAPDCKLAELTIERCKVKLIQQIVDGTFAKIYKGTVLERDGSEEKVIVKTVVDHSSPVQMALLLHEGLSLVGISHKNIYSVIGVAAEERVSPFVIYPDDGFRNLKRFLQRTRQGLDKPITSQAEIVQMAIGIGSGIAYLHRNSICHRDIAARNCVVDDSLNVKISDAALSRDLFPDDYQWIGEAESRSIKWSSPECILQSRSSIYSDMWSYGVLLWELTTLAQQPYAEIEAGDLYAFLKLGYRLSQPINCPEELYIIMTSCWTWEADDRPKWSNVLPDLKQLQAQLAQYV